MFKKDKSEDTFFRPSGLQTQSRRSKSIYGENFLKKVKMSGTAECSDVSEERSPASTTKLPLKIEFRKQSSNGTYETWKEIKETDYNKYATPDGMRVNGRDSKDYCPSGSHYYKQVEQSNGTYETWTMVNSTEKPYMRFQPNKRTEKRWEREAQERRQSHSNDSKPDSEGNKPSSNMSDTCSSSHKSENYLSSYDCCQQKISYFVKFSKIQFFLSV